MENKPCPSLDEVQRHSPEWHKLGRPESKGSLSTEHGTVSVQVLGVCPLSRGAAANRFLHCPPGRRCVPLVDLTLEETSDVHQLNAATMRV